VSFCPEKTQIELAWLGPAVSLPFPVFSPANAVPAPAPIKATTHTPATIIDFFIMTVPLFIEIALLGSQGPGLESRSA
jgi:hypothetical protein